jgi:hypothetical protein
MGKTTSTSELKTLIILLSQKQEEDERLLKEQLLIAANSLRPANIIKSTFSDFSNSTSFKDSLINNALSLAGGYVSKKIVEGEHPNPISKTLGTLIQIGMSSLISSNSIQIKSGLAGLVQLFSGKKDTQ